MNIRPHFCPAGIYFYTSKKRGKQYACFLDFSKAFDAVWRVDVLKILQCEFVLTYLILLKTCMQKY